MRALLATAAAALLSCGTEFPTPPDRACEGRAPDVYCLDDVALRCGPAAAVLGRTRCVNGDRCVAGFGCGACAPGARDCAAPNAGPRVCGSDGRWRDEAACGGDEVCEAGRCIAGCDDRPEARETRGCEFWATQTINASLGRLAQGADRDAFPFTIIAANPWPREITVVAEGGGVRASRVGVASRGEARIEAPWNPALVDAGDPARRRSGVARGAAVRLRTSLRVSAWQFNPLKFIREPGCEDGDRCYSYTNGASQLLPASALGRSYVVVSLPTTRELAQGRTMWTRAPGFVAIVGTAAGTRVTVTLRGDIESSADGRVPAARAGDRVEVTLDAGDVLQLVSAHEAACAQPVDDRRTGSTFCRIDPREDLTGSRVEASAPVAVFAGHDCALLPFDRYACDHAEEQIPPVETLGTRYVVARAAPVQAMRDPAHPEGEPTMVKVVAAYDGTEVTVTPAGVQETVRLAAGESLSFFTTRHVEVATSRPALVASALVGADYIVDPSPRSLTSRGDPSIAIETPLAQWRSVHDLVAPLGFDPNYLDLVAAVGTRVLVDEVPLSATPDASLPGRWVWRVQLSPGLHRVRGAGPQDVVGARVYGYAPFTSYMTRGGADLRALPVPQ